MIFELVLGLTAILVTAKGYYQSTQKKNSFGETKWLFPLGIFVWGDAVTIGPFWIVVAVLSGFINNPHFTYSLISFFWFVRALGEVQYWIAEQFASKHRNKPKDLLGHQFFSGDAIWFGYQTFWQMVMIFSGIATAAFVKLWLF